MDDVNYADPIMRMQSSPPIEDIEAANRRYLDQIGREPWKRETSGVPVGPFELPLPFNPYRMIARAFGLSNDQYDAAVKRWNNFQTSPKINSAAMNIQQGLARTARDMGVRTREPVIEAPGFRKLVPPREIGQ